MEIVELVKNNMLDYAGAVNQSRAIPDARTGLKPIHRKILYEMYVDKIRSNGKYKKCAYMVGQIIARFSEHGDAATYDALTRLAQPWIQAYPLLDFHGNAGSQFGDDQAAMRYTEAKLAPIAELGFLNTLNKDVVDWIPNFTNEEEEPVTLPAVFPGLFCLASQGMGYAAACHFVSYNLAEVADYLIAKMNGAELPTIYPDFPTGGTYINPDGIAKIHNTGKGSVVVESKYEIKGNKIIITEIPFNVAFDDIYDSIVSLCKQEKDPITFIADLINNSGDGKLELIIEVQKGFDPQQAVNILFDKTKLRNSYPVNQVALVDGQVKLLSFAQMADVYIEHNTTCIRREFAYDFGRTYSRMEILEGMLKALASIDEIVTLIRASKNNAEAKEKLMSQYGFTENQTKAILDMKLARLTNLEGVALQEELEEKKKYAAFCEEIMNSESKQKEILIERLQELVNKFGIPRRTKVEQKTIVKVAAKGKEKVEEMPQDVVIILDNNGYLKCVPMNQYRKTKALNVAEFKTTTKDLVLLFSTLGKFYRVSPKDIEMCGVTDKGKACGAIVKLEPGERIIRAMSMEIDPKHPYVSMITNNALVKKCLKEQFVGATRNLNGVKCITLDGNEAICYYESNGDVLSLISSDNYSLSFKLDDLRDSGKAARGVVGMKLNEGAHIVDCSLNKIPVGGKLQKRGGRGRKI